MHQYKLSGIRALGDHKVLLANNQYRLYTPTSYPLTRACSTEPTTLDIRIEMNAGIHVATHFTKRESAEYYHHQPVRVEPRTSVPCVPE